MKLNIYTVIVVGLGGAFGSVGRYFISSLVAKYCTSHLPIATLIVNLVGSFFIGVLFALFYTYQPNIYLKLFLITGFLGAMTTYSTFAIETYFLINNSYGLGIINIALNLFGTVLLAGIGYKIVEYFLR